MVALPLLNILEDQKSPRKVSYDEPLVVPKGYDMSLIDRRRRRRGAWLRRSSLRSKVSRLRRRGPRWMLTALLLLLAGDVVLAIIAWLIIERIVR
jgi:hypothetical protein